MNVGDETYKLPSLGWDGKHEFRVIMKAKGRRKANYGLNTRRVNSRAHKIPPAHAFLDF